MPKLAELLDVEKIKEIVNGYFEEKILDDIKQGIDSHYPTVLAMNIIKAY